jgi:hypothetical protein
MGIVVSIVSGIGCGVESMSTNAMGKDAPDVTWELVQSFLGSVNSDGAKVTYILFLVSGGDLPRRSGLCHSNGDNQ